MASKKERQHLILIHDSNWANNIGNPFFTQGAKYVIEQSCRSSIILSTASHTLGGWNPKPKSLLENDLNYITYSEPDWFVLTGPLLDKNIAKIYEAVFQKIFKNGKTKLVLLSAGGITYSEKEIATCTSFLKKYRPFILFTRDSQTYNNYSQLADYAYNGICTAFFIPDYYKGYDTNSLTPYIALTFDTIKEPKFEFKSYSKDSIRYFKTSEYNFKSMNRLQKILPQKLPIKSGIFNLVRPVHRVLNVPSLYLLRKPNSFFSMTHYGYLNIYRNTSLTLTDRVHACVATLAYGNPARIYTKSKRAQLLERVGLGSALHEVVLPDREELNDEKFSLIETLSNIYGEVTDRH